MCVLAKCGFEAAKVVVCVLERGRGTCDYYDVIELTQLTALFYF